MMKRLLEKVEEKVNQKFMKWPQNFPKNIPKKAFFENLEFYNQLLRYVPKKNLEYVSADMDDLSLSSSELEDQEDEPVRPRIVKIQEIQEKLDTLKGKSLNVKNSLKRKGLKNRLKKKLKLEKKMEQKINKNPRDKVKDKINSNSHIKKQEKIEENKEKAIVYSKFDFPGDENNKKKGPRDPFRTLQKVQKSNKKLKEMEARGRSEKVKEIKQKLIWEAAIKNAGGEKVKNDINLLKKSINKIKNAKNKSKKKWDERDTNKIKKIEDAQKKRKTNIQKKKEEKRKKKVKKLIKKGRIIV